MYKDTEIQKLIDNLDIVQVIGEYVTLKKTGANYKGLSPFKEERTPSFVVSPTKNIFKDFSMNIGGNVISFYMKINNIGFYEAIEELSRKYNVSLNKTGTERKKEGPDLRYYEIMREAHLFFKSNIFNSDKAMEYMGNRGFSKEEIQKFEIGFSPDSWDSLFTYLKEKGYSEKELLELGLIRKNDKGNVFDYFRNRIIFPIYNNTMKLTGFGGRTIENSSDIPKYLNSPDSKIFKKGKELFGLYNRGENIKKKGLAILMEGYLDVLTAQKNSFINSVASLGTAFTEEQAQLLKKYTNNVIIAYDNDSAGKAAVIKAGNILKKYDFNVRCLQIEGEVKDPDEYLRAYGRKSFLEILKTSKNIFEFLYDHFSENLNLNDISGKKEIIKKFKEFFSNITNKTESNLYLSKLSVELGVDREVLSEELSGNLPKKSGYKNSVLKRKRETVMTKLPKEEKYNKLEKETLKFMLKYKTDSGLKSKIYCKQFEQKKFSNIIYKEIFEKLKEIEFNIGNLNNLTLEEEEKELITTLKLQAEIEMFNEERQYKDIFVGWFLREVDFIREIIEKKDKSYIVLQRLKSELKTIHNINEIEEMYKEFKLIRRSDYV